MTVSNVVVIVLTLVVFAVAILVPFPGQAAMETQHERDKEAVVDRGGS